MSKLIIIDDNNAHEFVQPPTVDGEPRAMGLIPRNYETHPVGYCEAAKPFPDKLMIDRSEWRDRLELQKKAKSRLIDIVNRGLNGKPIPSRDQSTQGYCWGHNPVSCMIALRALMNEPYVDLSAYGPCCIIKGYRNQGGYESQAVEFLAERGCPSSEFWPQQSKDKKHDNPETWANAAKHKFGVWFDLEPRNLDQFVSANLHNMAVAGDHNWWGHSVGTIGLEEVYPDSIDRLISWIWNSWGDSWSEHGRGQLKGKKALPDAMQALWLPSAAAA